jgi:hypothetical protein
MEAVRSVAREAHVERHDLSRPDLDVPLEGAIAVLSNLDPVNARRNLDREAIRLS